MDADAKRKRAHNTYTHRIRIQIANIENIENTEISKIENIDTILQHNQLNETIYSGLPFFRNRLLFSWWDAGTGTGAHTSLPPSCSSISQINSASLLLPYSDLHLHLRLQSRIPESTNPRITFTSRIYEHHSLSPALIRTWIATLWMQIPQARPGNARSRNTRNSSSTSLPIPLPLLRLRLHRPLRPHRRLRRTCIYTRPLTRPLICTLSTRTPTHNRTSTHTRTCAARPTTGTRTTATPPPIPIPIPIPIRIPPPIHHPHHQPHLQEQP